MGQLILTRTIWDLYVKQFGACNIPYISCNDIGENVSEAGKVEEFFGDIAKLTINKGTKDNVSCVVISFKDWYILIEVNIFSNNFFLFFSYFFVYRLNIYRKNCLSWKKIHILKISIFFDIKSCIT